MGPKIAFFRGMMRKLIGKTGKSDLGTTLLLLFLFFWISPSAAIGESYRYVDIHPSGWADSRVTCINGYGEAVGFGTTGSGERGFLWSAGTITEILPPGADSARAAWINDSGDIAGTWEKDGVRHAFLLRGSTFHDPTPDWGTSEATYVGVDGAVAGKGEYGAYVSRDGITEIFPGFSSVAGGNSSGQWVGNSGTASVLFLPGRGYLNVTPPGTTDSTPHGINESGIIAVTALQTENNTMKGYVKSGEFYINMTPAGWNSSRAMAINDFNEVAGYGDSTAGRRSFLWSSGSTEEIAFPGWTSTEAVALNNDGQVAGSGTTASGETHAFVASPPGAAAASSPVPGTSGGCAMAPHDAGGKTAGSAAASLIAIVFPLLLLRGRVRSRRATPR
jgi:probable HAF family extracellular repeat protein